MSVVLTDARRRLRRRDRCRNARGRRPRRPQRGSVRHVVVDVTRLVVTDGLADQVAEAIAAFEFLVGLRSAAGAPGAASARVPADRAGTPPPRPGFPAAARRAHRRTAMCTCTHMCVRSGDTLTCVIVIGFRRGSRTSRSSSCERTRWTCSAMRRARGTSRGICLTRCARPRTGRSTRSGRRRGCRCT